MKEEFLSLLDNEHLNYYKTAEELFSNKVYLGSLYYYKRLLDTLLLNSYKEKNSNDSSLRLFLNDSLFAKLDNVYAEFPKNLDAYNIDLVLEKIDKNLTEEEAKILDISLRYIIDEILIYKTEEKNRKEREAKFKEELNKLKEA